jgi:hypothetical protein
MLWVLWLLGIDIGLGMKDSSYSCGRDSRTIAIVMLDNGQSLAEYIDGF